MDILRESAEIVQRELGRVSPVAGLVLGSGWGAAAPGTAGLVAVQGLEPRTRGL